MASRSAIKPTKVSLELLLGKVVQLSRIGVDRAPCAQVRCKLNEFDSHFKKFYGRSFDYWALDGQGSPVQLGDLVLIRQLSNAQQPTRAVTHQLERIVYQFGNIIDPITKRRLVQDEYEDELDIRKKLVQEIIEEPFQQESLLFMERRQLQRSRLDERRKGADLRRGRRGWSSRRQMKPIGEEQLVQEVQMADDDDELD